jgi:hypothetical protein
MTRALDEMGIDFEMGGWCGRAMPGRAEWGCSLFPQESLRVALISAIKPNYWMLSGRIERLAMTIAREGPLYPLAIEVEGGRAHVFNENHRVSVAQRFAIPFLSVVIKHEDKVE